MTSSFYQKRLEVFLSFLRVKHVMAVGGSPGLVVMERDSRSEGHWFEFWYRILDGHFFTYICWKIAMMFVWKDRKRGRGWPILSHSTENILVLHFVDNQCEQILQNFATLAKVYESSANFWWFISYLAKCLSNFGKFVTFLGWYSLLQNIEKWSNHLGTPWRQPGSQIPSLLTR